MWKGYKNPLEQSHLWSVDNSLTSKGIVSVFVKNYSASVEAANSQKINTDNAENLGMPTNDKMAEANNNTDENVSVSVAPALMRSFYSECLLGSGLHLIHTIMMMMPPQIMKMLISHVQEHGLSGENNLQHDWRGYFYGAILLGITVFQSLISGQYYEIMFRVGMKVRTVLISAIYRKSLRLSNAAKKDSSVGEIVNLMSIDVQHFMVSIF